MLRYALVNPPRLDLGRRHLGQSLRIPPGYKVVPGATKYEDLQPGDLLLKSSPNGSEWLMETLSSEAAKKIDSSLGPATLTDANYVFLVDTSEAGPGSVRVHNKITTFARTLNVGWIATVYRSSTSPDSLGSIPYVPIGIGLAALSGIAIWYFSRK